MSINRKQNAERQLKILAAQRQLYSSAKVIIGIQMIMAGPVAMTATLLGIYFADFKNYAALLGVTTLVLDLTLLNPLQKKLRGKGASVQEEFDTTVLDIEWNELKVGKRPVPELIYEYARAFGCDAQKLDKLKNWYPVEVKKLPIHWGRIVCQRANLWWDSTLRRTYANTLLTILILLAISLVWFAFIQDLSVTDFVMKMVIPMAALYKLGVGQFIEHRDAADRLDNLRDHAEKLWSEAIKGASLHVLKLKTRNLQDEIFDGRKRNPPVFYTIFWIFRNKHESQMNQSALALIQDVKKGGFVMRVINPLIEKYSYFLKIIN
jgi:hypothetical protein